MSRRFIGSVILTGVLASSSAFAGPITGVTGVMPEVANDNAQTNDQRAEEDRAPAHHADLFDPIGLPLLRVSGPLYLQLGERNKLRYVAPSDSPSYGASYAAAPIVGNLNPELPISAGTVDPIPGLGQVAQIPEPATVLLLVPAAALAIRRRARGRK